MELQSLMFRTLRGRLPIGKRSVSFAVGSQLNYVNGCRATPSQGTSSRENVEPATGRVLGPVHYTDTEGVDEAVASASASFHFWSKSSGFERGAILLKAAQKIRDLTDDIARLEVKDCGKPLWEAKFDISACADAFQYFGGLAQSHCDLGNHIPVMNGSFVYTRREPLGVCAAIGAWNFPFLVASWKVAPALACGNTVVYKPSEFTPLTAVVLAEILTEAGLPAGCLNVIQGDASTGNLMCVHADVSKVSFTGSVSTGRTVMATCAQGIKKVTLELGGKSPLVLFEDCQMENAVKAVLVANFLSQGQVCSNASRVYVHRRITSEFIEALIRETTRLKVGDPMADGTHVGATIHGDHAAKVLSYIQTARNEGAEILCGGDRILLDDPDLSGGYYLSPCVIGRCVDTMQVVRDEVFGAVVSVLEFDSEDEVIQRANSSTFGLAGGVFTQNISRAHRVASALQCGTVWINNYNLYPPHVPFGGYKMSGIGRENGLAVIDHFTQLKSVYVEQNDVESPFL